MVLESNFPTYLRCTTQHINPTLCTITITIDKEIVDIIYNHGAHALQRVASAHGFAVGAVPIAYITQSYESTLAEHAAEVLLKYMVIDALHAHIFEQKILIAGPPRLAHVQVAPGKTAQFHFQATVCQPLSLHEWRYFPFKAPKRKQYKDLDRQVESFIKEEHESMSGCTSNALAVGDWVNFDITLMNKDQQPLIPYTTNLWLRLGDEEADSELRDLFLGKKQNDSFTTANKYLHAYFSTHLEGACEFRITITDTLSHAFFCIDLFKKNFKLKTNKELYQKLIEVFSYRNDLSQRRAMAEQALQLLVSKHTVQVPSHLVLRQQKTILERIQHNPDYHVYRMQKDFKQQVQSLADRQAKEIFILDQIAFAEGITVQHHDIKAYLNLTKRPRMKEFIYFDAPHTKLKGQEIPWATKELAQACLREKTLNHIIYYLTRK